MRCSRSKCRFELDLKENRKQTQKCNRYFLSLTFIRTFDDMVVSHANARRKYLIKLTLNNNYVCAVPDRHARIDFKCQKFPKFGFDSKPICMRKEWSRTQILKKWRPSKSGCKSILKFNGLKIVQQKTLYKRYF